MIAVRVRISDGKCNRSEEHTSELQSPCNLVCRLLLEKKKKKNKMTRNRTRSAFRQILGLRSGLVSLSIRLVAELLVLPSSTQSAARAHHLDPKIATRATPDPKLTGQGIRI